MYKYRYSLQQVMKTSPFLLFLTTAAIMLTPSLCACPANQYVSNSICLNCPNGFWTDANSAATVCTACQAVDHCTYTSPGCGQCSCDAGFAWGQSSCQPCGPGTYKSVSGTVGCAVHLDLSACQGFAVKGTAFNNSQCLSCPPLPSNAQPSGGGCAWGCLPGFANTGP